MVWSWKKRNVQAQRLSAEKAKASGASWPAFPCQEISRWKQPVTVISSDGEPHAAPPVGHIETVTKRAISLLVILLRGTCGSFPWLRCRQRCFYRQHWRLVIEGGRTALPSPTQSTLHRGDVSNTVGAILHQPVHTGVQSCHRVSAHGFRPTVAFNRHLCRDDIWEIKPIKGYQVRLLFIFCWHCRHRFRWV